jgi:hypothetical protein
VAKITAMEREVRRMEDELECKVNKKDFERKRLDVLREVCAKNSAFSGLKQVLHEGNLEEALKMTKQITENPAPLSCQWHYLRLKWIADCKNKNFSDSATKSEGTWCVPSSEMKIFKQKYEICHPSESETERATLGKRKRNVVSYSEDKRSSF